MNYVIRFDSETDTPIEAICQITYSSLVTSKVKKFLSEKYPDLSVLETKNNGIFVNLTIGKQPQKKQYRFICNFAFSDKSSRIEPVIFLSKEFDFPKFVKVAERYFNHTANNLSLTQCFDKLKMSFDWDKATTIEVE